MAQLARLAEPVCLPELNCNSRVLAAKSLLGRELEFALSFWYRLRGRGCGGECRHCFCQCTNPLQKHLGKLRQRQVQLLLLLLLLLLWKVLSIARDAVVHK